MTPTICVCGCGLPVAVCMGTGREYAIIEATALQFGVTVPAVMAKGKACPDAIAARHVAMALVREVPDSTPSFAEVGHVFGVDHGTVMHACRKVGNMPAECRAKRVFAGLLAQFNNEGGAAA